MRPIFQPILLAGALAVAVTGPAFAHAHLRQAVPNVGSTVPTSPSELQLTFTENIVPAFYGVHITNGSSGAVPIDKLVFAPANTIHVPLAHALKPATYLVSWHAVSVDTHHTQGSYKFTIAP